MVKVPSGFEFKKVVRCSLSEDPVLKLDVYNVTLFISPFAIMNTGHRASEYLSQIFPLGEYLESDIRAAFLRSYKLEIKTNAFF